jgi:hypothetical protein
MSALSRTKIDLAASFDRHRNWPTIQHFCTETSIQYKNLSPSTAKTAF